MEREFYGWLSAWSALIGPLDPDRPPVAALGSREFLKLTLSRRSYPVPSLRSSERDRAAALEVRKRNSNSLREALS